VEAGIRYLPLYPDDPDVLFNEPFFGRADNVLQEMLPESAHLAEVVRVIDVPERTGGKVLRVLMNADLDEAVAVLSDPSDQPALTDQPEPVVEAPAEDHWRWRLRMAERIATDLDPERFGLAGAYVFGSTKNATARPDSDLDLLLHFRGDETQRAELTVWLDGWSRCLAEANYLRTGCRTDALLDVHLVTDEDIARQTSYAAKIDAVTDPARPLALGG